MEQCGGRPGCPAREAHAGHADALGFHHRLGHRLEPGELRAAAPPHRGGRDPRPPHLPRRQPLPQGRPSRLSAARGATADGRHTGRSGADDRGLHANGRRWLEAIHGLVHGRQARREYGRRHRQGRNRRCARAGQDGVRPSAEQGRRGRRACSARQCARPHDSHRAGLHARAAQPSSSRKAPRSCRRWLCGPMSCATPP